MAKYLRKLIDRFSDINIFSKMIISFTLTIVLPLLFSYMISSQNTERIIINQVCSDTLNTLELVARNTEDIFKKMVSVSLFVGQDENIKNILLEESGQLQEGNGLSEQERNLIRLERINRVNAILDNIANNTMGVKCYITLISPNMTRYTNWQIYGSSAEDYLSSYFQEDSGLLDNKVVWKGIEKNYVFTEKQSEPYVITLTKGIVDIWKKRNIGTFIISVPESHFKSIMGSGNKMQRRIILDQDSRVISSTFDNYMGATLDEIYENKLPQDQKGYFIDKLTSGERTLITYYRINNREWTIVDFKSYDQITHELSINRNKLLTANLFFMIVFLGVAGFIAKSITRPLKSLTREMLKADLNVPDNLPKKKRKDEIGVLQQSFNIMRQNISTLVEENLKKERKKKELELEALQAQVSPHFLFNTLSAIRWAAMNNNSKKAADMVYALGNLLRMTLVSGDDLITVEQEIQNLENYVAIMKMRHATAFEFKYSIEEDVMNYRIPKLMLQPLVENSIIHGFSEMTSGGIIEISGFKEENHVVLIIKDNGRGFDENPMTDAAQLKKYKFSGIGVNNIHERIKLYYGDEYGLEIQSSPGNGTVIRIRLPLN